METYGLEIINPNNGELVVSSSGTGLYCVGKMAPYGSVVQVSGVFPSTTPGRLGGYSRYRIASVNQPIIAIDLPLNKRVGLRSLNYIGDNVWEVEVHCGDTPDVDGFDTVEYALDVWAFAQHSGSPEDWGLAIYGVSGALAYDFIKGVPLAAKAYVSGTAGGVFPALTRPVFLGWTPTDLTTENFQGAGNTWYVIRSRGAWQRVSATAVNKVEYVDQKYRYFSPATEPIGVADGDVFDQPGFIIEGAWLP